jgi:iron(III) transport system permease protein
MVTTLPLLAVVYRALAPSAQLDLPDFPIWRYALTSLWLVLGVSTLSLILGVAAAWFMAMYRFPLKRFFSWALILPLACPAFILAYGWGDVLDVASPLRSALRQGLGFDINLNIRSLGGAIFILSMAYFPYIYLTLKANFQSQSQDQFDQARLLGLKPHDIFWRVALPLSRPALIAGLALTVMETLADYGAVNFLSVQTLTLGVVRAWSVFGSTELAARLGLGLISVALTLLILERYLRSQRGFGANGVRRKPVTVQLSGLKAWGVVAFCSLLLAFGALIPIGWLIFRAIHSYPDWERLVSAAQSSLSLSFVGAFLTLGLATLAAFGLRRYKYTSYALSLGYATPGAVMAIGLLVPASLIWNQMHLTSSFFVAIALLLLAYMARLMAAAYEPINAGLTQLKPNMALAARTLGANTSQTLTSIELPLIRGTFLTAGLLVFVDITKELPATLILRPFELETLAVLADRYAGDERLSQAAWPSLLILAISVIPSLYLSRRLERPNP